MRIELFFKTSVELINSLKFVSICSTDYCMDNSNTLKINIPNKVRNDPLLQYAKCIKNIEKTDEISKEFDICVHYSLKNNCQNDSSFKDFITFMKDMNAINVNEVLLVSGSSKSVKTKRKINTVSCLEYIYNNAIDLGNVKLSVAYNCYYPHIDDRDIEYERLLSKINTGLVSKVYLQFGTDIELLRSTLERLQTTIANPLINNKISIVGSLFIPSKLLLNRFKFRPWNGVYLSDAYLDDINEAIRITNEIKGIYDEYNVEIIVESAMKTDNDFRKMMEIVGLRDSVTSNVNDESEERTKHATSQI